MKKHLNLFLFAKTISTYSNSNPSIPSVCLSVQASAHPPKDWKTRKGKTVQEEEGSEKPAKQEEIQDLTCPSFVNQRMKGLLK